MDNVFSIKHDIEQAQQWLRGAEEFLAEILEETPGWGEVLETQTRISRILAELDEAMTPLNAYAAQASKELVKVDNAADAASR